MSLPKGYKPPLESAVQKDIMDYLRLNKVVVFKHRNVGIKKANGSYIPLPDGEKGISDLIGVLPGGQFLAIEVKRPGKKPDQNQYDFLAKIQKEGGEALWADSLDTVIWWWRQWKLGYRNGSKKTP